MTLTIKDLWATLSPAKIIKEVSAAILVLGGYYFASTFMSTTGDMAYFAPLVRDMYWVTIILVFLSLVMASLKSPLPAFVLLISSISFALIGYEAESVYAMSAGLVSTVLFAVAWKLQLNWSVAK